MRAAVPLLNKLPAAPSNVLALEGAVKILNRPIFTPNTTRPLSKQHPGSCRMIDAPCFPPRTQHLDGVRVWVTPPWRGEIRFQLGGCPGGGKGDRRRGCKPDTAACHQVVAPWRLPEFYQRFPGRRELMDYAQVGRSPGTAAAP